VNALGPLAVAVTDILPRFARSNRAATATPFAPLTTTGPRPFSPPGTARYHDRTATAAVHTPPQPIAVLAPLCSSSLARLRRAPESARQRAPPWL